MPDNKRFWLKLPSEGFFDKAETWLGGTIIAGTGFILGALMMLGLSTIGDVAFLAFAVALITTIVRHLIRIDRSEESDNFEEISLRDRWHLVVPKRLPARPSGTSVDARPPR